MASESGGNAALRSESAVFEDIARLSQKPSFIHALALLSLRANAIQFAGKAEPDDLANHYSYDRLIRTELSTAVGLMIQSKIDFERPDTKTIVSLAGEADTLFKELHDLLSAPMRAEVRAAIAIATDDQSSRSVEAGPGMREPIFYSGESAYFFQYRDLAAEKYSQDREWLKENFGFEIGLARSCVIGIEHIQTEKITMGLHGLTSDAEIEETDLLPLFCFSKAELISASGVSANTVHAFLNAFSIGEKSNAVFTSLHMHNEFVAKPILRLGPDLFCQLVPYGMSEAIYDGPFYWMMADKAYRATAERHRGSFAERVVRSQLESVFGPDRVFQGVNLLVGRDIAAEIDVLAIFGDRAIVVQAKSKRLTLAARGGDSAKLAVDFKGSVQDAYDQALLCCRLLKDRKCSRIEAGGKTITLPELSEFFPLCVVSDHYPALQFQAEQFLKFDADEAIRRPLIADVFTTDVLSEMLHTPLRFLSYFDRRAALGDKIVASHELTVLAYHLCHNLYLDPAHDAMFLDDTFNAALDIAMLARRVGLPGDKTPDGILTRFKGTSIDRLIQGIEQTPVPATISLGIMLLEIGEDSFRGISRLIDQILASANRDGLRHDASAYFKEGNFGITVHAGGHIAEAMRTLSDHCRRRKYHTKADRWYGVFLDRNTGRAIFGINLCDPWKYDSRLEKLTEKMVQPSPVRGVEKGTILKRKVGRNQPCPCGSGMKYKKCHGH